MTTRWCLASIFTAASLFGAASAAQAASTTAHALVVSGVAGHAGGPQFACATSGPQPLEGQYFGSASVGLPTEGYAYCGLAGGFQATTGAGISTANEAVTAGFSGGTHSQTATATADYGVLKAASSGTNSTTATGGFVYHAGDAAAYSTDTLPVPIGAAFVQLGLGIDGSASITGNSQTLTILDYQINSGPIYEAFIGNLVGTTASAIGLDGTLNGYAPVAGFTVGPGSLSGSGTVTSFRTAITGATFDLTLALLASSFPAIASDSFPINVADNGFADTSRLTSLRFFDAAGNPIAFGTLTGASGRLYDADGVHTAVVNGVPEPASWALMLVGFAGLGIRQRRVRRLACQRRVRRLA